MQVSETSSARSNGARLAARPCLGEELHAQPAHDSFGSCVEQIRAQPAGDAANQQDAAHIHQLLVENCMGLCWCQHAAGCLGAGVDEATCRACTAHVT